ncbi:MAG: AMP-binding protein [Candidatus Helarchaeota archaeon]
MVLIGDIVLRNATLYPDDIWLHFEGRDYTWKLLNERVNSVANALKEMGVKKGTRVALLLENCDQLVISYFAIPKIGALCVPLNYMSSKKEILYMLNDCTPNTFIFGERFQNYIDFLKENNKSVKNWICV